MFAQRLDRFLESYGFCSERSSASFLRNNRIEVNGRTICAGKENGLKNGKTSVFESECADGFMQTPDIAKIRKTPVDSDSDEVFLNGKRISLFKNVYLLMNKPCGYVCSSVSDQSPTVFELLGDFFKNRSEEEKAFIKRNLHSVGRLDKDTSGVLLLTTNGAFSHFFSAPQSNVQKTYEAVLEKSVLPEEQDEYRKKCALGLVLPAEKKAGEILSKPAKLVWLSERSCRITVCEGRFHEVRRIFLALGNQVLKLKRVCFSGLCLDESKVPEGFARNLTLEELEALSKANCKTL